MRWTMFCNESIVSTSLIKFQTKNLLKIEFWGILFPRGGVSDEAAARQGKSFQKLSGQYHH